MTTNALTGEVLTREALTAETGTIPVAAWPIPAIPLSDMKPERIQNNFAWLPPESAQSVPREMRGWGVVNSRQTLLRSYRFTLITDAAAFGGYLAAEANSGPHDITIQLDGKQVTVQIAPYTGNLISPEEFELARRVDREYRDRKRSGRI